MSQENQRLTQLQLDAVRLLLSVAIGAGAALYFASNTLGADWSDSGIGWIYRSLAEFFGATGAVNAALLGLSLGVLVVWTIDTFKKFQVLIPLAIVLAVIGASGISIGSLVEPGSVGLVAFFALVGIRISGVPLENVLTGGRVIQQTPREYRKVTRLALFGGVLLVVGGLFDTHVRLLVAEPRVVNLGGGFWNVLSGVVVIGLLGHITRYNSRRRIMMVGPARSGKTSLMGGIYTDIKQGGGGDRGPREGQITRNLTENALEGIENDLTVKRQFVDRTVDRGLIQFEYYCRKRIFRQKITVACLDVPGEELTGGPENKNPQPMSTRLKQYREDLQDRGRVAELWRRLKLLGGFEDTGQWPYDGPNEISDNRVGQQLHLADYVIFTLPLDDFLGPLIQHSGSSAIPSHADIYLIEREDEDEFTVTAPDGSETKTIINEHNELVTSPGKQFEPLIDMRHAREIQDGFWYFRPDHDRDTKAEYLQEYRQLVSALTGDRTRDFAWALTMADLTLSPFEDAHDTVVTQDKNDSENDPEGVDYSQFVRNEGYFEATGSQPQPATRTQDYKLLGRWLLEEIVNPEYDISDLMEETDVEYPHPVWFDLEPSESGQIQIQTDQPPILNGSRYLLERLEDVRLEERVVTSHPEYSLSALLRRRFAQFETFENRPPSWYAYQELPAAGSNHDPPQSNSSGTERSRTISPEDSDDTSGFTDSQVEPGEDDDD